VFPATDDVRKSAVRHLASVAARDDLIGEPKLVPREGDCGPEAKPRAERASSKNSNSLTPVDEHRRARERASAPARSARGAGARNIAFVGVKLEPLADVAVVRDLEALESALESPTRRVAWLAVLRAPFVGRTLAASHCDQPSESGECDHRVGLAHRHSRVESGWHRTICCVPTVVVAVGRARERETRAHLVERVWLSLGAAAWPHARKMNSCTRVDFWRRSTMKTASAWPAGRSTWTAS
jgi:hypothetical protein